MIHQYIKVLFLGLFTVPLCFASSTLEDDLTTLGHLGGTIENDQQKDAAILLIDRITRETPILKHVLVEQVAIELINFYKEEDRCVNASEHALACATCMAIHAGIVTLADEVLDAIEEVKFEPEYLSTHEQECIEAIQLEFGELTVRCQKMRGLPPGGGA